MLSKKMMQMISEGTLINGYCETNNIDSISCEALKRVNNAKIGNPKKTLDELFRPSGLVEGVFRNIFYTVVGLSEHGKNCIIAEKKLICDKEYRNDINKKLEEEIKPEIELYSLLDNYS